MSETPICLVMAGGKGTRFWPESTGKRPKQYLSLMGGQSLLADTLDRFEGLVPADRRYIVTVKEQSSLVEECAKNKINSDGLIFEPSGRNTAPCILLALAKLLKNGASSDEAIAVVPSDHVILNKNGFQETLSVATKLCRDEKSIVTIGITANFPHTGYGYIHRGEAVGEGFKVAAFKEKPNVDVAKKYIESGEYFWNAGMFVGTISVFLEEFEKYCPSMYQHLNALKESFGDDAKLAEVYDKLEKDSIDYAIMEKSDRIQVVASRFDWNDLGSWDAMESVLDAQNGNCVLKDDGHHFINAKNNIVHTPGKFVSLINVDDLVVVCNENAVLVMPKKDSQEVKKVVEHLNQEKRDDLI